MRHKKGWNLNTFSSRPHSSVSFHLIKCFAFFFLLFIQTKQQAEPFDGKLFNMNWKANLFTFNFHEKLNFHKVSLNPASFLSRSSMKYLLAERLELLLFAHTLAHTFRFILTLEVLIMFDQLLNWIFSQFSWRNLEMVWKTAKFLFIKMRLRSVVLMIFS